MSKLALLKQYRYSPAAGGIFGTIGKVLGGAVKLITGVNLGGGTKAAAVQAAAPAATTAAVSALMKKGGGGGGRRGRGISATELKGYRKVSGLLKKEGMVSKRARGRNV